MPHLRPQYEASVRTFHTDISIKELVSEYQNSTGWLPNTENNILYEIHAKKKPQQTRTFLKPQDTLKGRREETN